ncbi:MAG: peptidase domain-containing ABC transporter [Lewinellaceae bacterium]|nr:peptidase domain-containing ABC transporter [Phaeodactylibacter sp.]MCB9036491.1 peptidase domain-containing ABC transporter [Lewinellaceae bacterium]
MKTNIKQHDVTDCGAACLCSVSAFHKLKLPISRIRQMASTDQKGTNVLGLLEAAEKLGFSAKGVRGDTGCLDKIPLPAIAHVIVEQGLHHFVVVYKVKKKSVIIMDPAVGKRVRLSTEAFRDMWTGILVLLTPNDTFRPGNRQVPVWRRFWELARPHKTILVQALFGAVVYTLLGLSTSIYIQKITDFVLVEGNVNLLNLLSTGMLILLGLQIFIGVLKNIFTIRTGQKIDALLLVEYYKHLLRLPQRFFDTMRVGEIISRVNDAIKIRTFVNDVVINLLVNVLVVAFSFGLMFTYYWKLGLILFAIVPLYALIYLIANSLNKKRERQLMQRSAELESQLVESLNAIKTIKLFGLETFAKVKTESRIIGLLNTSYRSGLNTVFSMHSTEFASKLFVIILLWTGSYFVIHKLITPGELLSFYALVSYFTGPSQSIIHFNKAIQNALIAADRLFEVFDIELEEQGRQMELLPKMIGDIRFEQAHFRYGSRKNVFEGLDLVIPRGKITAIVGESGSGKSTLAALIQKVYPLNEGSIRIGRFDIKYISDDSLRRWVSVVPQKLDLFAGNVIENIAVGELQPDMQRVMEVCQLLGLEALIKSLPSEFNTYLGENGANLSGGQRQRLALARALYRDPEILILDEATSSLDSISEEYVQRAIQVLKSRGKTIIIIAHRLSTVMNADKIVVLENGHIREQGGHRALLGKRGHYFRLWEKQFPQPVRAELNGAVA